MALGLPDGVLACLFDLDGVLTDTAAVHALAWQHTFDAFLRDARRHGLPAVLDTPTTSSTWTASRARTACATSWPRAASPCPRASPDDPPTAPTVHGVGNRKNAELTRRIAEDGVEVFEGSRRYLQAAERAGLRRIVVSSSANTALVLRSTGLDRYVEGRIDGVTLAQRHLAGKPSPDSFLAGAELAGVPPAQAAVFEDALAGVAAGRAGRFGYVVGVDRVGQADELRAHGADVVVRDLAELLDDDPDAAPIGRSAGGRR